MNYTGFKLGEKKFLKDKEPLFHSNSKRILEVLHKPNEQAGNIIHIDWPAFSTSVTSENMRPYLGDAVYDRWCGGIATDLESFSKQSGCSNLAAENIQQIQISAKEETTNPGEIQLNNEGILQIIVNGKRTGNNYELGFVTNYLNDHIRCGPTNYDADLTGFTLREGMQISSDLHYLTKANATLHSQLPHLNLKVDFNSFQQNVTNTEHRKYLGSHICEYYCNGIAGEIEALCIANVDAKEAMDAIKSIVIDCDTVNGVVGSTSQSNAVTLKDEVLRITVNPAKVGYRYMIGTVRTFLENNL